MKYRLKDDVNFKLVSKKVFIKYDFCLDDYYDEKTRIITFPEDYITWHLMAEIFKDFLELLGLVEKVSE